MNKINFKLTRQHIIYIIIAAAGLLIVVMLIFLTAWRAVSNKIASRNESSRIDTGKTSKVDGSNQLEPVMAVEAGQVYQGFEGGVVAPIGWEVESTNTTNTWKVATAGSVYTGTYSGDVEYDPDLNDQDEFLLTPPFRGDTGSVSFWSEGSIYWCKETNDNCDLEVWFIGEKPGLDDDVLLGKADDSWTENYSWAQSTFDFSPYLNGSGRIGFRYVGNDGAQIKLDHITITYAGNVPTFLPLILNIYSFSE